MTVSVCRGVAKLVKAPDFDSGMRGFESFLPCHLPVQSITPFNGHRQRTILPMAFFISGTRNDLFRL